MAGKFIPALHPIAKAARGWLSAPNVKPTCQVKSRQSFHGSIIDWNFPVLSGIEGKDLARNLPVTLDSATRAIVHGMPCWDFTPDQAHYFTYAQPSYPFWIAVQFDPDGLTSTYDLVSFVPSSGTDDAIRCLIDGGNVYTQNGVDNGVVASARDDNSESGTYARTANAAVSGQVNTAVFYFESTTSRKVWLNGGTGASNAGSSSPANTSRISIGAFRSSAYYNAFDGKIFGAFLGLGKLSEAAAQEIMRDFYAASLEPANTSPFLVGVPGGDTGITGNLAATETGSDSAALVGDVLVAGDVAAQEAGSDTAALAGSILVSSDLAAQETGADTAALTGSVLVAGTLAVQETGSDIAAFVGGAEVPVTGDLAVQEVGSDTAALTGSVQVIGDLAALESGLDGLAVTGLVHVSGTLAVQETGQDDATIIGAGPVTVTGDLIAVEAGSDTGVILGTVKVAGTLSAQETGSDTLAITGSAPALITGDLAAQETGSDTAVITGTLLIVGDLAATETGSDTARIYQREFTLGNLAAIESTGDTASVAGLIFRNWDVYEQNTLDTVYGLHGKPAIYTVAGQSIICQMTRDIDPQIEPEDAAPGVRGEDRRMRVRASEITEPVVGATIVYKGESLTVEGYRVITEWEWQLDVRA